MAPRHATVNDSKKSAKTALAGIKKSTKKAKLWTKVLVGPLYDAIKDVKDSLFKPTIEFIVYLSNKKLLVHPISSRDYEVAVANANLYYRFSRPHFVVQPRTSAEVQMVVQQAVKRSKKTGTKIPIAIKNGGHSFSGASTAESCTGVLMDLSEMNCVTLDMDAEVMIMQGGARWGDVYKVLRDGFHEGVVVNGGRCPNVGVSGYTLGGGLGPFGRTLGMGCDSLIQAKIVTADGRLLTVGEDDDPKSNNGKLFWALRGGGQGSFGVVTELTMKIHHLQGDRVVAGRFEWKPKEGIEELLETMQEFYATKWPNTLTIDSTWLCRPGSNGDISIRFSIYFDGSLKEYHKVIDESISNEELRKYFRRRVSAEQSTMFLAESLAAVWKEETKKSFPENPLWGIYASFIFKTDAASIEAIMSIMVEEMEAFRRLFEDGGQPDFEMSFIHSGGESSKKVENETAFCWREVDYHTYIHITWPEAEKWLDNDMRGFLSKMKLRLQPYLIDENAAFANFPDKTLLGDVAEQAYFGKNRHKLRQVKSIFDPDDFFHWKASVRRDGFPRSRDDVVIVSIAEIQYDKRIPDPTAPFPGEFPPGHLGGE